MLNLEAVRTAGKRRAVFFDRDGVLTELVHNPATGEHESPHALADVRLCSGAVESLGQLQAAAFDLFIVSNQPSYAKGKVGIDTIKAIADMVEAQFMESGVHFRETFYCYHHADGIVPGYSGVCACRKPSPHFLLQAEERYGIDLRRSWMVGDRDSDIECGQRAGCRTILINHPRSQKHQGMSEPDYVSRDVTTAVAVIMEQANWIPAELSGTGSRGEGG